MSESKLFNRYTLIKTLAEAADAQTYKARDEHTQQTVVLKRLQLGKTNSWKRLELFQREAKVLASLEHSHIPQLLDFFKEETEQGLNAYLVNEWIEGEPLSQKIEQHWMPDEDTLLNLAQQMLWLLNYLHQFNPPVIHRDVKPSNLILNNEGKLFLIDFGGAQELLQPMGGGGSTVIGTFGYMAPEQFAGRAVPATDLYGLGASLVHLLSGRSPSNMPQKNMQIMFQGFVNGSGGLIRWITQLIRPALEDRYKSADMALQQLYELTELNYKKPPETARSARVLSPSLISLLATPLGSDTQKIEEAAHILQPGDFIEGYEVEAVLTCGTHTVSYFAKHPQTQASVFVKSIHFQSQAVWKGLELFEREVEALQRLDHHGIPDFIDTFKTDSQDFYLVTEKITGQNLEQKMRSGWRPTETEIVDIAKQALAILESMHAQKPAVIHRDIKPSNFMLDNQGKLYLIDFGGVQAHFQTQGTGGSTVIGTYGYIAPEEFLKKAVPATDLYSLGVTLVRLLSGHEPTTLPQKDLRLDFRQLLSCSRGLIDWLEDITEPDLTQRFRSAAQAKELLLTLPPPQARVPVQRPANTEVTEKPTGELISVDKMSIDKVSLSSNTLKLRNKKELVDYAKTRVLTLGCEWELDDTDIVTDIQLPILHLPSREYQKLKKHFGISRKELPGYVEEKDRKKLDRKQKAKGLKLKQEELVMTVLALVVVPIIVSVLIWASVSTFEEFLELFVMVAFLMVGIPILLLLAMLVKYFTDVYSADGYVSTPSHSKVPINRHFELQERFGAITFGFAGFEAPWQIRKVSCEKVRLSETFFILTVSTQQEDLPLLFKSFEEAQLMFELLQFASQTEF